MTDEMPHDDELQAAYRRLPADEPPEAVDAAILGAARRRSDEERRRRRLRRIRMSVPLAAAAGVILTLTLTRLGDDRRGALPPLGETARQESRDRMEMDGAEKAAPASEPEAVATLSAEAPAAPPPSPPPAPAAMAKRAIPSSEPLRTNPLRQPKKEKADADPSPETTVESVPGSKTEGGSHRSLGYIEGFPPVDGSGDAAVGGEAGEAAAGAAELHDDAELRGSAAPAHDEAASARARGNASVAALAAPAPAPKPAESGMFSARIPASPPKAPAAAAPWPFGLEAALESDEACRRITGALHEACAFREGVAVVTVDPPVAVDRGALAGRRVSRLTLTLSNGRLSRVTLRLPSTGGGSIEEVVLDAEAGMLRDR